MLAVLGPTATGKTSLAIELARRIDGEVISADSRQAYAGLVVGTAAPTPEDRALVPHHGVGFLEPGTRYGAGRFAREAREWIDGVRLRGREPILAGGSGLFYRALTRPIFREPPLAHDRRARLEACLEDMTLDRLRHWICRLDPALSDRLGVLDRQRCLRALEICLLTGRPLTWWQRHGPCEAEPVSAGPIILTLPGPEHRRRIRVRAQAALAGGWTGEVAALRAAGHDPHSPAFSSIGYSAVDDWMSGRASREEALTRIVRDTWAYARRQRTWFRHQLPAAAPRLDAGRAVEDLADEISEVGGWRMNQRADEANAG
jgi:tRNA dimethylallyltransferase